MGWLITGLFAATFGVVAITWLALERESARAARQALNAAVARFDLRPAPRKGWSGAHVFFGTVRGFEVTWTLTPREVAREVRIRVHHPKLGGRVLHDATPLVFSFETTLTLERATLELTFKDTLGDDASQLAPSTNRLLDFATRLADG